MNYNYKGSLAERFIKFRSGILSTTESTTDLFNAFSIYVPSTLAVANVKDVVLTTINTTPIVKEVTIENYKEVLQGDLLSQYSPIFNDDTNIDVILYIVIFYVPSAADAPDTFQSFLTVTDATIDYSPLTTAFDKLYSISFFKTMFSPTYDGVTGTYDDANYFDMALALSQLCQNYLELSYCLVYVNLNLPLATTDTNKCWVLSKTRAEEIEKATALNVAIGGVSSPRSAYFWGMLNLLQALNTWMIVHSENVNLIPIIFGKWFTEQNATGTYIGNKLSKVRLTGGDVKPTGTPSWLNSEANENLSYALYTILDDKMVSYLMSIADGTINDSIVLRAKSITGFPVIATQMSKWIDYTTSQQLAKFLVSNDSLVTPVLKNEDTYKRIQNRLLTNMQLFASIGRLDGIQLNFPDYSSLEQSSTDIVVTQGWTAYYVDDLEKVQITGTVVL